MMRLSVLSLAGVFLFAACSKSSSSPAASGSLSATVGAASFQGTSTNGVYSKSLGELVVFSFNAKDSFELIIPYPPRINQPLISDSSYIRFDTKGIEYDAFSEAGQAQLTVTAFDSSTHQFSGTFSATAYNSANASDSVVITNGKFTTSYTISN
jgi:hypothetical protein